MLLPRAAGKLKDTGVRFADIAGMDDIVYEMREVVKMMLGDSVYKRVGAKAPRVSGAQRSQERSACCVVVEGCWVCGQGWPLLVALTCLHIRPCYQQ